MKWSSCHHVECRTQTHYFLTRANGKSKIGLLCSGMPMMHPAIARVKGFSLALNSLSDVSQNLVCRIQNKFRNSISQHCPFFGLNTHSYLHGLFSFFLFQIQFLLNLYYSYSNVKLFIIIKSKLIISCCFNLYNSHIIFYYTKQSILILFFLNHILRNAARVAYNSQQNISFDFSLPHAHFLVDLTS